MCGVDWEGLELGPSFVLVQSVISSCVIILLKPAPTVINLEYSLKLKIKRNGWLLADTSSQSLRFILSLRLNSSFITSGPGCFTSILFLLSCLCLCSVSVPVWCHGMDHHI